MVVVGNARQRIMCGGIADGMPVAVKTSGFGKYRRRTGFGILKRPGKTLGAGRNIVIGRVSHARVGHCQVGFAARQGAQRRRGYWMKVAAAVILVGLGLGSGWMLRGQDAAPGIADRLIADAVSAHTVYALEKRHAVEVASTDSEHLSSWLSNRLQTNLAMPDLTASGLTFLGGRLLPAPDVSGGRAAQLMYEDTTGARLTLYVTPSPGPDTPRYEVANLGLDTALFWSDDVISCTITAPYSAEKLQAIARTVFSQLNPSVGGDYAT